jgi:hypothetical protein
MLGPERRAEFHRDFLPSDAQRAQLNGFARACEIALTQAFNRGEAAKTLAVLLASFPTASLSEQDAKLRVTGYMIALDDVPTWAIERAARKWLKGEMGDRAFAPSPAQLRVHCEGELRWMTGLAAICRKIADAVEKPAALSDEQRAANLVRLRDQIVRPLIGAGTDDDAA